MRARCDNRDSDTALALHVRDRRRTTAKKKSELQ
jgi:hypothetical protein